MNSESTKWVGTIDHSFYLVSVPDPDVGMHPHNIIIISSALINVLKKGQALRAINIKCSDSP